MPDPHRPWHSLFDVQHRLDRLPSPLRECAVLAYERSVRYGLLIPPALLLCTLALKRSGETTLSALPFVLLVYLLFASLTVRRARQRATKINDYAALTLSALHLRGVWAYALTCTVILGALTPTALHDWHVNLLTFVPIVVLNNAAESSVTVLLYSLKKMPPRKRAPLRLPLNLPALTGARA